MPSPSVMYLVGYLILQADINYLLGYKTLIRISSTPKGAPHKPGLFPIIEDIVANDGGGGRPYREALISRYDASPLFRQMLVKLGFFWSIPALLVAAGCTAVVFTASYPIAYGVGTYLGSSLIAARADVSRLGCTWCMGDHLGLRYLQAGSSGPSSRKGSLEQGKGYCSLSLFPIMIIVLYHLLASGYLWCALRSGLDYRLMYEFTTRRPS